jgi:hypothetical protein
VRTARPKSARPAAHQHVLGSAPAQWDRTSVPNLVPVPFMPAEHTASVPRAPAAPDRKGPGAPPGPTNGPAFGSAPSTAGSAILIAFLLGFVLAIPNAGRWLRPALALGLSPVTVSPADDPG